MGRMRGLGKQFFCMDTPGGENCVFGPENCRKVALAVKKISIDPAGGGAIWDGWDTIRRKDSIPRIPFRQMAALQYIPKSAIIIASQ